MSPRGDTGRWRVNGASQGFHLTGSRGWKELQDTRISGGFGEFQVSNNFEGGYHRFQSFRVIPEPPSMLSKRSSYAGYAQGFRQLFFFRGFRENQKVPEGFVKISGWQWLSAYSVRCKNGIKSSLVFDDRRIETLTTDELSSDNAQCLGQCFVTVGLFSSFGKQKKHLWNIRFI